MRFISPLRRERQDGDYRRVYVDGARNLIKALPGTPVRRIIYTSSTGVYRQQDGNWVDERSATEPSDERSAALLETEQILLQHAGDSDQSEPVHVTVVRLRWYLWSRA